MAATFSSWDPYFKEKYASRVYDLTFPVDPLFPMIKKQTNYGGRYLDAPVTIATGQAASATYTAAYNNTSSSVGKAFHIPSIEYYALATVTNKVAQLSKTDEDAFEEATTFELDNTFTMAQKRLSIFNYGDGTGSLGNIVSGVATTTLVVTNGNLFEIGCALQFAASATSGAVRSATTVSVTAVDPLANTVTVSVAPSTLGAQDGDYIFFAGDFGGVAVGNANQLVPMGLEGLCPAVAPVLGVDSFWNVDRGAYPQRLAGSRLDATDGRPVKEALIQAQGLVAGAGGKLTHFVMPFNQFTNLIDSMQGQVQYVDMTGDNGVVGFTGVKVVNGAQSCIAVPSFYCPKNRIFGINKDSLEFFSSTKAPSFMEMDGLLWRALEQSASWQARIGTVGNLRALDPKNLVNIQVNAASL